MVVISLAMPVPPVVMMASTVPEATQAFTDLRMKRASRYLVFKINDAQTGVEVEHTGARDATFD